VRYAGVGKFYGLMIGAQNPALSAGYQLERQSRRPDSPSQLARVAETGNLFLPVPAFPSGLGGGS
jgi:hypothetical protein